ncbi:MAG: hypothetical protein HW421_2067 [Ignavibacteria bacterium]|nr:hypothetical protein [Ignavibacteria bacterium]
MEIIEHIEYWRDSSNEDMESADAIFGTGRYSWCLFIGHLAVEKAIKAIWVQNNNSTNVPKTHNLTYLAEKASLNLTNEQIELLDKISTFNLEARYPDYKNKFHAIATKEFTQNMLSQIKEIQSWLIFQIK